MHFNDTRINPETIEHSKRLEKVGEQAFTVWLELRKATGNTEKPSIKEAFMGGWASAMWAVLKGMVKEILDKERR